MEKKHHFSRNIRIRKHEAGEFSHSIIYIIILSRYIYIFPGPNVMVFDDIPSSPNVKELSSFNISPMRSTQQRPEVEESEENEHFVLKFQDLPPWRPKKGNWHLFLFSCVTFTNRVRVCIGKKSVCNTYMWAGSEKILKNETSFKFFYLLAFFLWVKYFFRYRLNFYTIRTLYL